MNKEDIMNAKTKEVLPQSDAMRNENYAAIPFPSKLHSMLEEAESKGFYDVISWQADGKSFKVNDPVRFSEELMPIYFQKATKYKSFQRQLNIYSFRRVHSGPNKGGYTHRCFVRGCPEFCSLMIRRPSDSSRRRKKSSNSNNQNSTCSERSHPSKKPLSSNNTRFKSTSTLVGAPTFTQFEEKIIADKSSCQSQDDIISTISNNKNNTRTSAMTAGSTDGHYGSVQIQDPPRVLKNLQSEFEPPAFSFPVNKKLDSSRNVNRTGDSSEGEDQDQDTSLPNVLSNLSTNEYDELSELLDILGNAPIITTGSQSLPEDYTVCSSGVSPPGNSSVSSGTISTEQQDDQASRTFPCKLYQLLGDAEREKFDHIISWIDNGTCFKIYNTKSFVEYVMPYYFDQTQYESFRRQLNLYGFTRLSRGSSSRVYSHPSFIKDGKSLLQNICRYPIKNIPKSTTKKTNKKNEAAL